MMMEQNTKRSTRYIHRGVQEKLCEKIYDFSRNAELMII